MRHRKHFVKKEESTPEEEYNKKEEPIVVSKVTSDIILNKDPNKGIVQEHPADLMALYWFYYYVAKWQRTNRPKSTTSFAAEGLRWGQDRVRRTKKQLVDLQLIEDITSRDKNTNKITGHYIYVKFIWWDKNKIDFHTQENPDCGKTLTVENSETNALSTSNQNTLSTSNQNALNKTYILFLDEWNKNKIIIHKKITSKRKQLINKVLKLKDYPQEEIFKAFQNFAEILHSPNHYWTTKWSMEEFLQRGLNRFVDEVDPLNNFKNYFSPDKQSNISAQDLSPSGFPLIIKSYNRSAKNRKTKEEWQKILEGYANQLLDSNIWSPNHVPNKIAVFNGVVSMQIWLDKVDFDCYGGDNLWNRIKPLKGLIEYYILCVNDWWSSWMDGIKDNVFDTDNKIFKMFIREMETSFPVHVEIKSRGWINDSDWKPRD